MHGLGRRGLYYFRLNASENILALLEYVIIVIEYNETLLASQGVSEGELTVDLDLAGVDDQVGDSVELTQHG